MSISFAFQEQSSAENVFYVVTWRLNGTLWAKFCNFVATTSFSQKQREAYDTAIATLPHDAKSEFIVRERIAKRIMKAAYAGEINRERLRQSGLLVLRRLTKGGETLVMPVRDPLPDNTF